jgi:thioredoxin 1
MFRKLLKSVGFKAAAPTLPPEDRLLTSSNRPAPIDVTDADFAELILASDKLAVVDFWAEWCEPCHIMSAYVGFLAAEYAGRVLVAALDVDENPETPSQYTIMGLPTTIFFRNGLEMERIVGVANYAEFKQKVEQWLVINP